MDGNRNDGSRSSGRLGAAQPLAPSARPDWSRRSWLIEVAFGFIGAAWIFTAIMLGETKSGLLGSVLFIAVLPVSLLAGWQLEKHLPGYKENWWWRGVGGALFIVPLMVIHPQPWRTSPPPHNQRQTTTQPPASHSTQRRTQ